MTTQTTTKNDQRAKDQAKAQLESILSKIKLMKHYVQNTATGAKARCHYHRGELVGRGDAVTIYAKTYSDSLYAVFGDCENNTDTQTDYFEKDRFRILPSNPLFAEACARATPHNGRGKISQNKLAIL